TGRKPTGKMVASAVASVAKEGAARIVARMVTRAQRAAAAAARCSGPECAGTSCFVAGTLVLTPDGLRPVEDLQEGDVVVSRGPTAVGSEWRPAGDVWSSLDETLCSGELPAVLRADADRPFDGSARVPRADDVVKVLADEAAPARYLPLVRVPVGARVAFLGK